MMARACLTGPSEWRVEAMSRLGSAFACLMWALSCAVAPGSAAAQRVDDTILRLRDISRLTVAVGFLPETRGGGPCLMGRAPLEEHAAAALGAAGLQAVTGAETYGRSMEQLRLSQADVRAIQERRPLPPRDAEYRRRMAEIEFLRDISSLLVVFHATPLDVNGTTMCAVAVWARFTAIPARRATLAVNGREVRAQLLLWESQARSFIVQDAALADAVTARLDLLLEAFLNDWRLANRR